MIKQHIGRRALWAVAALLSAAPLRSAFAKPPEKPEKPAGPSLIWARNEQEFRQALQTGLAEGFLPMFDPRTDIEQSSTIVLEQRKNEGMTWGANGNHAKVRWVGPPGQDMIVIQGVKGVANRGLYLEKFNLDGGGYKRAPCGACLKLRAPFGDAGALYKFTLRDIYTSNGTYGIVLQGAVFEGMCENVHGENHAKDGMYMENLSVGTGAPGIVSNIQLIHPNMSRNLGAGVRSVYSCNAAFGSFILNAEGGIVAPSGLQARLRQQRREYRRGALRRSQQWLWVLRPLQRGVDGWKDGGASLRRCEERLGDRRKADPYVVAGATGVTEVGNHISSYGDPSRAGAYRVAK